MKKLNLSGINFWLEADQEKIDFETIDVTKKENKKLIDEEPQYIMEQAIILLPHFPKFFHYNYLCLKNDQNISQAFNETNEDEWFEQAIWYWKDRAWGIGIHIESNEEWSINRTAFRDNGLATYCDINDTLVNKLYFEIIYKDAIEYRKNKNTLPISIVVRNLISQFLKIIHCFFQWMLCMNLCLQKKKLAPTSFFLKLLSSKENMSLFSFISKALT
uniref:hypothetical protein n=1 Tax=Lactobacillus taiwanensis TaxID=508451 RepID=UPI002557ECB2|nr:hypothetical protein [Lactobacillus taiwanensis]